MALRILSWRYDRLIGIFLSHTSRFKIISPWDMSQYQNFPRISLERAFSTCISKFAFLWLCPWQSAWTWPQKRLGHEVNFLPTASGTVDQCTILTLSPQRHLFALKCYQWGRDAVKLTVKRIIKDLRVANFQDEYTKISFWGVWGWITAFKITGEKFILIKNTFLSANLR